MLHRMPLNIERKRSSMVRLVALITRRNSYSLLAEQFKRPEMQEKPTIKPRCFSWRTSENSHSTTLVNKGFRRKEADAGAASWCRGEAVASHYFGERYRVGRALSCGL